MLIDGSTYERKTKSVMPEGLSFFSLSVSPDRLKEKPLCALCASVVK